MKDSFPCLLSRDADGPSLRVHGGPRKHEEVAAREPGLKRYDEDVPTGAEALEVLPGILPLRLAPSAKEAWALGEV
jgi:hypothetical protein